MTLAPLNALCVPPAGYLADESIVSSKCLQLTLQAVGSAAAIAKRCRFGGSDCKMLYIITFSVSALGLRPISRWTLRASRRSYPITRESVSSFPRVELDDESFR